MLTVSLGSLQATGDAGATAMTRSLKDFGESSARILLHALSVGALTWLSCMLSMQDKLDAPPHSTGDLANFNEHVNVVWLVLA